MEHPESMEADPRWSDSNFWGCLTFEYSMGPDLEALFCVRLPYKHRSAAFLTGQGRESQKEPLLVNMVAWK